MLLSCSHYAVCLTTHERAANILGCLIRCLIRFGMSKATIKPCCKQNFNQVVPLHLQALEEQFPETPLMPQNSELREEVDEVCKHASEVQIFVKPDEEGWTRFGCVAKGRG